MKKISFFVSSETFENLMQSCGQRIPGRVWLERGGFAQPEFVFEPYSNRQPRRRNDQLLAGSEHGWLKKSARRYKLHLSVPDHLGELRTALIMGRESKALVNFMSHLDQLMSNV